MQKNQVYYQQGGGDEQYTSDYHTDIKHIDSDCKVDSQGRIYSEIIKYF